MGVVANVRRKHRNLRLIRDRHPRFGTAVAADLRLSLRCRGEGQPDENRRDVALQTIRLMWTSDAFAALVAYRAKAAMQRRGIPVLPRLAHHWAMRSAQVCIGDPVLIQPGVYVPHGQVVIDGFTEVGSGSRLLPWITLGLKPGSVVGPTLGANVVVGSGSKVLGPLTVGAGAKVGANAVVIQDIPPGATAVGVPAVVKTPDLAVADPLETDGTVDRDPAPEPELG